MALWDIQAQLQKQPLWKLLGGVRSKVQSGVSIGIQRSMKELLSRIEHFLERRYRRIKMKIKPGWDVEVVKRVRERFGSIKLMVDANGAYSVAEAEQLKQLDEFGLLMLEQPLGYDDLVDHARLQRMIETPVCLDESVSSPALAVAAVELGSCRVINIKQARVGGITAALSIHQLCRQQGIPVWCGGLLETGVGRAFNLALASLPGFTLPGDLSETRRYYQQDLAEPAVELDEEGFIGLPERPGLGFEVICERLQHFTVESTFVKLS
jgi:O-succinylbenzoate synthase